MAVSGGLAGRAVDVMASISRGVVAGGAVWEIGWTKASADPIARDSVAKTAENFMIIFVLLRVWRL